MPLLGTDFNAPLRQFLHISFSHWCQIFAIFSCPPILFFTNLRTLPSTADVTTLFLDTESSTLSSCLQLSGANVVVHTAGPFQGQGYSVARACIDAKMHYIDLADGREFVVGIDSLNEEAEKAGVLLVSGASSVPALSCAVVEAARDRYELESIDEIDMGINPGNKTERGIATVKAILSFTGHPIPSFPPTIGWNGVIKHRYPTPVGERLLSPCDVPDVVLFPKHFSTEKKRPHVYFRAGLELPVLHYAMVVMGKLTQLGIVKNWAKYGWVLMELSKYFMVFGSHHGAMHVTVKGKGKNHDQKKVTWTLLAADGDGPNVPVLAATAMVRKLQRNKIRKTGAMPCMGFISVDECIAESEGLSISTSWKEEE